LFVSSLFSCNEKVTVALYLWTNPHPLKSCPFPSFPLVSLTTYHRICCLFEATKQR